MTIDKKNIKAAFNRIEAIARDPINSSLENGFRDHLDFNAVSKDNDEEITKRLKESLDDIVEIAQTGLRFIEESVLEKENKDYFYSDRFQKDIQNLMKGE